MVRRQSSRHLVSITAGGESVAGPRVLAQRFIRSEEQELDPTGRGFVGIAVQSTTKVRPLLVARVRYISFGHHFILLTSITSKLNCFRIRFLLHKLGLHERLYASPDHPVFVHLTSVVCWAASQYKELKFCACEILQFFCRCETG